MYLIMFTNEANTLIIKTPRPTPPETISHIGIDLWIIHLSSDMTPIIISAIGKIENIARITVEIPFNKRKCKFGFIKVKQNN